MREDRDKVRQGVANYQQAVAKVQAMSNDDLSIVYEALDDYNPNESYAPGVLMDDWAQLVYSEISRRKSAVAQQCKQCGRNDLPLNQQSGLCVRCAIDNEQRSKQ